MEPIPKRKLVAWIKDEKKSARVYEMYGLPELARDERHHAMVLSKLLRFWK